MKLHKEGLSKQNSVGMEHQNIGERRGNTFCSFEITCLTLLLVTIVFLCLLRVSLHFILSSVTQVFVMMVVSLFCSCVFYSNCTVLS